MTVIPFPRRTMFGAPLALLTGPPVGSDAPHPDAHLLQLCQSYRRLEAEYRRMSIATDVPESTPGFAELWRLYETNIALNREALDAIAETPARTLDGIKAKADALMAFYAFDDGRPGTTYAQDYPVHRAIWSLIEDAAKGGQHA